MALGSNLVDALDVSRPKTNAVRYSLERANDGTISWSVIIVGVCMSVFGYVSVDEGG